jgi:hypothetical protein
MNLTTQALEHLLKTNQQLKVLVIAKEHANCDSLPLRYGIHFETDSELQLNEVRLLYKDYQYPDRFHVDGTFTSGMGARVSGHFVIGSKPGHDGPVVFTVWQHDLETEMRLSEVMKLLRKSNFIYPEDLLELHPLYVSGKLSTHADLVYQLSLKVSAEQIAEMEIAAKAASDRADMAITELTKAKQEAQHARTVALEATFIVDQLEEQNNTLSSRVNDLQSELESYKSEQAQALKERSEATLSLPDTLIEVHEAQIYRGSSCTILIMGDGTQRHMKTSTFDQSGAVTQKALSLVGRRVRISCWDPIGQPGKWSSQGYFRNVYEAE